MASPNRNMPWPVELLVPQSTAMPPLRIAKRVVNVDPADVDGSEDDPKLLNDSVVFDAPPPPTDPALVTRWTFGPLVSTQRRVLQVAEVTALCDGQRPVFLRRAWNYREYVVAGESSNSAPEAGGACAGCRGGQAEFHDTAAKTVAVCRAAVAGHVECLCALHCLGAAVDGFRGGDLIPVRSAAAEGHTAVVEAVVRLGGDVDQAGPDGRTAMHAAFAGGHCETIAALQRLGGDVNRRDVDGLTPLDVACRECRDEAIRAVVAAGAKLKASDDAAAGDMMVRKSAAHHVVEGDIADDDDDADCDAVEKDDDDRASSVASSAAAHAKHRCLRALHELGAPMDAVDDDGRTPLHVAAEAGDAAVVRFLVRVGADPATVDADGASVAELALGHPAVLRVLQRAAGDGRDPES